MSHDPLFKTLLRVFFADILALFLPALAARLVPAAATFLDPEAFLDVPQGQRRIADLVARVPLRPVPLSPTPSDPHIFVPRDAILLHVESQAQPDPTLPERLRTYNTALENREGLPALSMAFLPFGDGNAGTHRAARLVRYGLDLDRRYARLGYWLIGLRDLDAWRFARSRRPVGVALAALMRPGSEGRGALKLAIVRTLGTSILDDARGALLVNCVQTYLRLTDAEQVEYARRSREEEGGMAEMTELTWVEQMEARGEARLLRTRFGAIPDDLELRLTSLHAAAIERLADRVLQVQSLDEFLADLESNTASGAQASRERPWYSKARLSWSSRT